MLLLMARDVFSTKTTKNALRLLFRLLYFGHISLSATVLIHENQTETATKSEQNTLQAEGGGLGDDYLSHTEAALHPQTTIGPYRAGKESYQKSARSVQLSTRNYRCQDS